MKNMILSLTLLLTIGAAVAQSEPVKLDLDLANQMINKALACGKENGWNLSVAVVNSEGNLMAFQRSELAFVGSIEVSIAKAKSSNAFQRPTKVFAEGVSGGNGGLVSLAGVVANAGGLPIKLNNIHSGAIGVSGATAAQDEQCAAIAIR